MKGTLRLRKPATFRMRYTPALSNAAVYGSLAEVEAAVAASEVAKDDAETARAASESARDTATTAAGTATTQAGLATTARAGAETARGGAEAAELTAVASAAAAGVFAANAQSLTEVASANADTIWSHNFVDDFGGVLMALASNGEGLVFPWGEIRPEDGSLTFAIGNGGDGTKEVVFTPTADGVDVTTGDARLSLSGEDNADIGRLRVRASETSIALVDAFGGVVADFDFNGTATLGGFVFDWAAKTITAVDGTPIYPASTVSDLRVGAHDTGVGIVDPFGGVVAEFNFNDGSFNLNGFRFDPVAGSVIAPSGEFIYQPLIGVSDPIFADLPAWSSLDDSDALAIMNAHYEAPTQWRRRFIYNFVAALKTSGAWAAISGPLYMPEADNAQAAAIDWKNPGNPYQLPTPVPGNPYSPPGGATHVKDRGWFDSAGAKITITPNLSALTTGQLAAYNAARTEWLKNVGAWRPTSHAVSPDPRIVRAGDADAARFSRTSTPLIPDVTVCGRRTLYANYGVPLDFRERASDGSVIHHPVGAHGEGPDSFCRVQVSDDDNYTFDFGAAIVLRSPDNIVDSNFRLGIIDCHIARLENGKAVLFAPASTSRRSIWAVCVENPLASPRDWKMAGVCFGDFGFVGKGRVQPSGRFLYTANDVLPNDFDPTGNPLYADYGAKVCELVEYDGQLRSNRVTVIPPPPDYTNNEFTEASIVEWPGGDMVATFRANDGQYFTSKPSGGSWAAPARIAGTIDSRADLSVTPDNRLLFAFNKSTRPARENITLWITPVGARDLSVIEREILVDPRGWPDPTVSYLGIDYKRDGGEWWIEGCYDRGRGRRPLAGTAAADAEFCSEIHFFRIPLSSAVSTAPIIRRTVQRG
jgi:hypothetical protein